MISVVMAMGRFRRLHPLDAAHVFIARIEALHGVQDARGAGLHGEMDMVAEAFGLASMASMMGLTKSRGCEVVKRTRRMPGILADAREKLAKSRPAGVGSR